MDDKLYLPAGSSGHGAFRLNLTPERAGWTYCGLRVLELAPGGTHTWDTGQDELLVLPLAGAATVSCDGETFELHGRQGVFDRVSDFCYAPRDATVTVSTKNGGTFAVPSARCGRRLRRSLRARRGRPGRAARRGPGQPSGQQLLRARVVRRATSSSRSRCSPRAATGPPTRRTSTTRPGTARRPSSRRSTTSRPPGWPTSGSTAPRTGPSTCWRRCGPATWCSSRTAGTAPRWPRPAMTCTTST